MNIVVEREGRRESRWNKTEDEQRNYDNDYDNSRNHNEDRRNDYDSRDDGYPPPRRDS